MCLNRIKDGSGPNYHLFMNSVKGITEIIGKAGLTSANCRVVCADNRSNKAKLPEGFSISSANDPVKTINFYTSTCFEGCDLFDENGRTFIICDPNKPNTLLDISTSMLQICGRIRNSIYKGEMTLVYNTTRYEEDESLDLYMKRIEREKEEAEQDAMGLNQCSERFRKQFIAKQKEFNAPFIRYENGEIIIDQNMINLDIINYKIIHGLYSTQVNLDSELSRNSIDIADSRYADERYVELMSLPGLSFKDCCEKYAELKPEKGKYCLAEDEELVRLRNICPEACDAVDKLGIDTIRSMKFHKSNILRKVAALPGLAQEIKIKRELDRRFSKYQAYTLAEIKKTLGEIYEDVNLSKKPVATDLNR